VVQGYRPSIGFLHPSNESAVGTRPIYVDPLYIVMMQQCWDAEPNKRPICETVVKCIQQAWLHSVHRHIKKTSHIVDSTILTKEYMNATFEITHHNQHERQHSQVNLQQRHLQHEQEVFEHHISSTTQGPNSKYSYRSTSASHHHYNPLYHPKYSRIRVAPPSPDIMNALETFRHELRWHLFDTDYENVQQLNTHSEGSYLVVAPIFPEVNPITNTNTQNQSTFSRSYQRFFGQSSSTSTSSKSQLLSHSVSQMSNTTSTPHSQPTPTTVTTTGATPNPLLSAASVASAAAASSSSVNNEYHYHDGKSTSISSSLRTSQHDPLAYSIVWATRKWLLKMGYLLHDLLALDTIDSLAGYHTDVQGLRHLLHRASNPEFAHEAHHMMVNE
jgi:hypothetical protein